MGTYRMFLQLQVTTTFEYLTQTKQSKKYCQKVFIKQEFKEYYYKEILSINQFPS